MKKFYYVKGKTGYHSGEILTEDHSAAIKMFNDYKTLKAEVCFLVLTEEQAKAFIDSQVLSKKDIEKKFNEELT